MPQFTTSWFERSSLRPWTRKFLPLADTPIMYLEIGTFEGQSAAWMLENVLKHPHSHAYCIDPWLATRKIPPADMDKKYQLTKENLKPYLERGRVTIYRDKSENRLPRFPDAMFDIIHVDGDHEYPGVKLDQELGWTKLRPGGIMVFDDYRALRKTDGVTRLVNEAFFGVNMETGEVTEPPVKADLFYETSKQAAFRKPVQSGDINVSPIAEYTARNLHERPAEGPWVYARPRS